MRSLDHDLSILGALSHRQSLKQLVYTTSTDLPRMVGDGSRPEDWSSWEPFCIIDTPSIPGFNCGMPGNAGCLWGDRATSGTWLRAFCAADLPAPSNFGYTLGIETGFRLPAY